jgi:F-type H+-transporting ATPase subunit b
MMNLNATLFGEILIFCVFIWFVMKFVWPPLVTMMEERKKTIADGLAAAEKGHRDAELAQVKAKETINEAKAKAAKILEQAEQRAHSVVEASQVRAREEGERLVEMAQGDIQQQTIAARDQLIKEVSGLAMQGASKILNAEVNKETSARLVDEMIKED